MAAWTEVWKVAAIGIGPKGEGIVNTFHYGCVAAPGAITGNTFAAAFLIAWEGVCPGFFTTDYTAYGYDALCLAGPNVHKSAFLPASAGILGTLGGPSAPLDLCAIVRRSGLLGGKKSRGRMFMSPLPASWFNVDAKVTPVGFWGANVEAFATASLTVAAILFDPTLYKFGDVVSNQISVSSVAPQSGVQKSRRLRLPN
jgi:hypothetical protein